MSQVQDPVGRFLDSAGNDPNLVLGGGSARLGQHFLNLLLIQPHNIREVITRQICFWEQHDAAAVFCRCLDKLKSPGQVELQGFGPMHLDTGHLQGFRAHPTPYIMRGKALSTAYRC